MTNGRKLILTLVALGIVLGLIFGIIGGKSYLIGRYLASYTPPPVTIAASRAVAGTWASTLDSVGTLHAVNGADLSAEVSGIVRRIDFTPGQQVRKGAALLEMDDSTERAQLKSLQAQLQLANINYQRDRKLLATKSISRTDFDTGEAQLKDIRAQVEALEATIAKKTIRAPFSGRVGIPKIDVGQYLEAGEVIVTLQSVDRLYVDFRLAERHVPQLSVGQTVHFAVTAYRGRSFDARVAAIDAKVDPNTRYVEVRATVISDQHLLTPGMFAEVHVVMPERSNVIIVPQTAVSYSLYGDSVFVLQPAGKQETAGADAAADAASAKPPRQVYRVHRRYIDVVGRRDAQVAIAEGIKPGELVVTAGQLKLNNDTRAVIGDHVEL